MLTTLHYSFSSSEAHGAFRWSAEEAAEYLEGVEERCAERRHGPPWKLDLSWLQQQGVPLPAQ